jgi:hypothetical protein
MLSVKMFDVDQTTQLFKVQQTLSQFHLVCQMDSLCLFLPNNGLPENTVEAVVCLINTKKDIC